jgi:hypothetical protein
VARAWTAGAPLPAARGEAGATVGEGGRFYLVGGDNDQDPALYAGSSTLQAFDPATRSWALLAPMPTPRTYVTAATLPDGRIVAIGGTNSAGPSRAVEAYDHAAGTWTTLARLPRPCQSMSATRGPDGRIYVAGGDCLATGVSSQLLIYDAARNRWRSGPPLPDARTMTASAWGGDGRLYVVGGYGSGYGAMLASGVAYDPQTRTWSPIADLPTQMVQHQLVPGRSGRSIIALAGIDSGGGHAFTLRVPT